MHHTRQCRLASLILACSLLEAAIAYCPRAAAVGLATRKDGLKVTLRLVGFVESMTAFGVLGVVGTLVGSMVGSRMAKCPGFIT